MPLLMVLRSSIYSIVACHRSLFLVQDYAISWPFYDFPQPETPNLIMPQWLMTPLVHLLCQMIQPLTVIVLHCVHLICLEGRCDQWWGKGRKIGDQSEVVDRDHTPANHKGWQGSERGPDRTGRRTQEGEIVNMISLLNTRGRRHLYIQRGTRAQTMQCRVHKPCCGVFVY